MEHCPATEGTEELQPENVTDFYREGPPGIFTRLGPATPDPCVNNVSQYTYIGGSAELSHILFSTLAGSRWSFDETQSGGSTLYEYIGAGNTCSSLPVVACPSLVGVDSGNKLVSDCGTRLGSSTPNEANGSFGSMYNAISASGERIFFTAVGEDDNFCGASQPPVDELFAREEAPIPGASSEMRTVPISCLEDPSVLCKDANFEGASQDGSKVFFTSTQKLLPSASEDGASTDSAVGVGLPPNEVKGCAQTEEGKGGCNLYEYDFERPVGERLIDVSAGSSTPRVQGVARISEDGSHIYFVAKGALTGVNREGVAPAAGGDNLYVYTEGHTLFIVTLSSADNRPEVGEGDWARADNRPVQTSWEGRFLVFTSVADLTRENVTPGKEQVFQYDAEAESLVRASIGQNGYGNDNRTPANDAAIVTRTPAAYIYSHADSPTQADGVLAPRDGAVFFTSPDALTPQALNDRTDTLNEPMPNVYEYRAGSVYLLSDGRDESTVHSGVGVVLLGSDLTGGNVFFTTSDALVGQDTDTQQDIYDARVEGGILSPTSSSTCLGEGCRSAPSPAPMLLASGSAMQPAELSAPSVVPTTKPAPRKTTRVKKKTRQKKRRRAKKANRRDRTQLHGRIGRR